MRFQTRIIRHQSEGSQWELAVRRPALPLQAYIHDICGYSEKSPAPLSRREFPAPQVVVIIEFGTPLRVFAPGSTQSHARYTGGFVAGLDDRFTLTEHDGAQQGIQLNLTPIGARLFFGIPMSELRSQVVSLDDLLPPAQKHLAEKLASLPHWDARFDLIERLIMGRIGSTSLQLDVVAWAVRRIEASAGTIDMRTLAAQMGYSQKHAIKLFHEHVGVPPKLLARIVRFDRLVQHLKTGGAESWSELALKFHYYDQAHMIREVRRFTGLSPGDASRTLIDFPVLG